MVERAKAEPPRKAGNDSRRPRADLSNIYLLKVAHGTDVLKAVQEYAQDPNVEYAEPNYIVRISAIPDDPMFANLWGLHNTGQTGGSADDDIDAPEAWDYQTGSSNITIAVIDTGVDYIHEDLSANMWINPGEAPGNGIDDDSNGYIDDDRGWDFSMCQQFLSSPPYGCIETKPEDRDPYDDHGHGTHCAGTIGSTACRRGCRTSFIAESPPHCFQGQRTHIINFRSGLFS